MNACKLNDGLMLSYVIIVIFWEWILL